MDVLLLDPPGAPVEGLRTTVVGPPGLDLPPGLRRVSPTGGPGEGSRLKDGLAGVLAGGADRVLVVTGGQPAQVAVPLLAALDKAELVLGVRPGRADRLLAQAARLQAGRPLPGLLSGAFAVRAELLVTAPIEELPDGPGFVPLLLLGLARPGVQVRSISLDALGSSPTRRRALRQLLVGLRALVPGG